MEPLGVIRDWQERRSTERIMWRVAHRVCTRSETLHVNEGRDQSGTQGALVGQGYECSQVVGPTRLPNGCGHAQR